MIDIGAAIRDFLLAQTTLYALVSTRIYAESDMPEPNYKPSVGPAICFKVRGGVQDYSEGMFVPSLQIKIYGATPLVANTTYRALWDALHGGAGASMRWAQNEILGTTLAEPDSGWPFVLTFFRVWIRAT